MKLRCKLIAGSDVEHLHQIYAGFAMLHRAGEIELTQVITDEALQNKGRDGHWNDYRFFNTTVVVNDTLTVAYDMHDRAWIDPEILAASDLYFKRSYLRKGVERLDGSHKVHPLGLNMQVNDPARDLFRFRRAKMYGRLDRVKAMLKALRVDSILGAPEVERIDNFEAEPQPNVEPRIIFMARMWDPKNIESKVQSAAVAAMNRSRAASIRQLKKEFGKRFLGGVAPDDYSRKRFADVVIDDILLTQKRNYLKLLREFPICVATTGLNGSNGWKLAEYVAGSKAIVSEPLVYEIPGHFEDGSNYLSFNTTDELIAVAHRLMGDHSLRSRMMSNNQKYYERYVRPDALVRNSLNLASSFLCQ